MHILLRYDPTYSTFSALDHIPVLRVEHQLMALIFTNFKSLRDIGLEGSDVEETGPKGHLEEESLDAKDARQRGCSEEQELNREIELAFEQLNSEGDNQPYTFGRVTIVSPEDDIFTE